MSPRFVIALLVLLLVLATGCTSARITNLTPQIVNRAPDGLYTFAARWDTNQRAVRDDSFKPYVVVGTQFYPMDRVAMMTNRWEALVPIGTDRRFVNYQFKFDYQYNGFGKRKDDSLRTSNFQLEITDK